MKIQSAVPSIFPVADFSGAVLSMASIGIEDEDGAVFAGDLDLLCGVEAPYLRIPGRRPGSV
jgi:hypothetical protein